MIGAQTKRCPRKSKRKKNKKEEDRSWRRLNSINKCPIHHVDCGGGGGGGGR